MKKVQFGHQMAEELMGLARWEVLGECGPALGCRPSAPRGRVSDGVWAPGRRAPVYLGCRRRRGLPREQQPSGLCRACPRDPGAQEAVCRLPGRFLSSKGWQTSVPETERQ